jgi:glycopeptide antibiotics resistance protein
MELNGVCIPSLTLILLTIRFGRNKMEYSVNYFCKLLNYKYIPYLLYIILFPLFFTSTSCFSSTYAVLVFIIIYQSEAEASDATNNAAAASDAATNAAEAEPSQTS